LFNGDKRVTRRKRIMSLLAEAEKIEPAKLARTKPARTKPDEEPKP
jgi:hypothetical protein